MRRNRGRVFNMNEEKIKILQINAGSKNFGGVSAFVYNVYKNINREIINFDFLSPNKTTYETVREEIENMGGNIFELNIDSRGIRFYYKLFFDMNKFLKRNRYDVVHINSGVLIFNIIVATSCRLSRVKKIIVHSHNAKLENNRFKIILKNILKKSFKYLATDYLACSMLAAKGMFSNKLIVNSKVKIIKNGIDINKFKFNSEIRDEYRKKLHIENKFVIGHIGRFVDQKNHNYLIDVFNEVVKINNNAILLLIGEGELEEDIKQKVKQNKLEEYVKFLGIRKDIPELMQAMDTFILPSKYEGLPIVAIEAQATGLRVILSDTITKETKIIDDVEFFSIKNSTLDWCNKILENTNNNDSREKKYKIIEKSGYTIQNTAKLLQEIYIN